MNKRCARKYFCLLTSFLIYFFSSFTTYDFPEKQQIPTRKRQDKRGKSGEIKEDIAVAASHTPNFSCFGELFTGQNMHHRISPTLMVPVNSAKSHPFNHRFQKPSLVPLSEVLIWTNFIAFRSFSSATFSAFSLLPSFLRRMINSWYWKSYIYHLFCPYLNDTLLISEMSKTIDPISLIVLFILLSQISRFN